LGAFDDTDYHPAVLLPSSFAKKEKPAVFALLAFC
jgi:hypothetical protein